jgi:DNA-binding transcriptional regulator/RsmH inhibitor MraZ
VIVGVNSRVEIWSVEAWRSEQERFETSGSQIAEVLAVSRA